MAHLRWGILADSPHGGHVVGALRLRARYRHDVSSIDVESAAPTVLWRMFRTGREHVRAVLLPGGPPYLLAFFANEQMDRAENYGTMDLAVFRADEIRRSLTTDGWSEE